MEDKVIIEGKLYYHDPKATNVIGARLWSVPEIQWSIEEIIYNDIYFTDNDTDLFRITIERIK